MGEGVSPSLSRNGSPIASYHLVFVLFSGEHGFSGGFNLLYSLSLPRNGFPVALLLGVSIPFSREQGFYGGINLPVRLSIPRKGLIGTDLLSSVVFAPFTWELVCFEQGCDKDGSYPSGFRNVNNIVINIPSIADPDDNSHQNNARSENSVNLEIQPILGYGSEVWVQPAHSVTSNIDVADTASDDAGSADGSRDTGYAIAGNAGNASNGKTVAKSSGTAALINPDQERSVTGERLKIRPVSGDGGEVYVPGKSGLIVTGSEAKSTDPVGSGNIASAAAIESDFHVQSAPKYECSGMLKTAGGIEQPTVAFVISVSLGFNQFQFRSDYKCLDWETHGSRISSPTKGYWGMFFSPDAGFQDTQIVGPRSGFQSAPTPKRLRCWISSLSVCIWALQCLDMRGWMTRSLLPPIIPFLVLSVSHQTPMRSVELLVPSRMSPVTPLMVISVPFTISTHCYAELSS